MFSQCILAYYIVALKELIQVIICNLSPEKKELDESEGQERRKETEKRSGSDQGKAEAAGQSETVVLTNSSNTTGHICCCFFMMKSLN